MIHIVTALLHEARPILDFYHLKPIASNPYKIYQNEQFVLIVSGVGKRNASAATVYLHQYSGKNRSSGWLNLGIGGHSARNIGEGILAHKITDQVTGKSWYPSRIKGEKVESSSVLTVERVEAKYSEDCIYDMEASGFYEAASSFATSELVQCFKIVSDNLNAPSQKVSGQLVCSLVAQNLNSIDIVLRELSKLSDEFSTLESKPEELDQFLKQWHFTVTESHQLRRLLARLKTLQPDEVWFPRMVELFGSGRASTQVLRCLENQIRVLPVHL